MDFFYNLFKDYFNLAFIFTVLFWVFWLIYQKRKINFWVWLWQLKEYRRDRMKAHFDQESSKKLFFNKIHLFKIFLIFIFSYFVFFNQRNSSVFFSVAVVYFLFIFASFLFGSSKTKKPVQTKKAKILYFLSFFFFLFLFPICFFVPKTIFYQICFLILLVSDIILPIVIVFFLGAITPFIDFKKNLIFEKAKEKIRAQKDNLLVIGVTGSYGKTSVKEFLAEILSLKFKVLKTEANNNTEIGIAKTIIEKLDKSHEIFVVEMAAYKKGEIRRVCNMVFPTIGIITGIGNQHFRLFGSQENIISAKYEIIENLPDKGLAVFNGDSNFFMDVFKKTKKPKKFYSIQNYQADVFANDIREFKDRTEFKINDKKESQEFKVNLLGKQAVSNVLGACLVARELGISFSEMKNTVNGFKAFPKTLEIKSGINGAVVIDDSYSGNFEGVISALDYLKNYQDNKKIIVFYPIIELGAMARDVHKKIGKKIAEVCDFCILVNSDFSREIKEGAIGFGMDSQKIKIIENSAEVVKQIKDIARKGDVILLENRISSEIITVLTEKK